MSEPIDPGASGPQSVAVPASDTVRIQELLRAGYRRTREAHVMVLGLPREEDAQEPEFHPFLPGGQPPVRWEEVLPSWLAAYPPEHPDHLPGGATLIDSYLAHYTAGAALGPLICAASAIAVGARDGYPYGGVLIVDRPGEGAWVCDVWRDPDPRYAGCGSRLLRWSAARLDGYPVLGLAVTVTNPAAIHAYERIGFTIESTAVTLLPPP